MAGGKFNDDDDAIVDINITPFVDVVLVLLVIFMVTAHFMNNRGMNIQLPKAANANKLKNQKILHLNIDKNSKYSLDGKTVSLDEVAKRTANMTNNQEQVVVTISADKGVVYDTVVNAMDVLRSVGVTDFALQLEPVH